MGWVLVLYVGWMHGQSFSPRLDKTIAGFLSNTVSIVVIGVVVAVKLTVQISLLQCS